MSELTVILKDSERTYRQTFLAYNDYYVRGDDPFVLECIKTCMETFGSEPESIKIRIHLEIQ